MKCISCGRSLPADTESCPYCGGKPVLVHSRKGGIYSFLPPTVSVFPLRRIILIIYAVLIALAMLSGFVYLNVIKPRNVYKDACESLEAGSWQEAAALFAGTRYKDSESLYYYCAAMYRYNQEAWADAADYFVKSDKPAPEGVYTYCLGRNALDKGLWSDAAQFFAMDDNFRDSEELRNLCLAIDAHEAGNFAAAIEYLPEGDEYAELFEAFCYSAYYDDVFLETLCESLEAGFAFAADADPAEMNASDALDSVYYAFYDIYDSNKDNFSSLFRDEELASLAERYIRASLRQWSVTAYSGAVMPGYCSEYYSLAAERRSIVAEIDEKYGLDVDREALGKFLACGEMLESIYEEYCLPLTELIETALKKPSKHDGASWLTLTGLEDISVTFNLCIDYLDKNGICLSSLDCEYLSLASGDGLLVCLDGYNERVWSTSVQLSLVQIYINGDPLIDPAALI